MTSSIACQIEGHQSKYILGRKRCCSKTLPTGLPPLANLCYSNQLQPNSKLTPNPNLPPAPTPNPLPFSSFQMTPNFYTVSQDLLQSVIHSTELLPSHQFDENEETVSNMTH